MEFPKTKLQFIILILKLCKKYFWESFINVFLNLFPHKSKKHRSFYAFKSSGPLALVVLVR
jgi:hypothetical protein